MIGPFDNNQSLFVICLIFMEYCISIIIYNAIGKNSEWMDDSKGMDIYTYIHTYIHTYIYIISDR